MRDHEVEQATGKSVCLGQAEKATKADAIGYEDVDHRQPEDHAKAKRKHHDPNVVGHDHSAGNRAERRLNVGPQLVVAHPIDELRRGDGGG